MKVINFVSCLYEKVLDNNLDYFTFINNMPLNNLPDQNNNFDNFSAELINKTQLRLQSFFDEISKKDEGIKNIQIEKCWIQHYEKYQYHEVHIHHKDMLSFVYFNDCTEDSSSVVFYNLGYPYAETHRYEVKPEKNKIILFPGYLPHGVKPNKDQKRRIVSGNLLWQK